MSTAQAVLHQMSYIKAWETNNQRTEEQAGQQDSGVDTHEQSLVST
jgi:hypothetical protein